MKRELKFRAYHKIQKRMFEVYGLGLDFITENTLDGVSPGDNCWQGDELKNIEIMQFTGLTDKNGVDIYENDVVCDNDKNISIITWINEWSVYGCMLYDEFERYNKHGIKEIDESMFWTFPVGSDVYKVIGNIHEHKHLLK